MAILIGNVKFALSDNRYSVVSEQSMEISKQWAKIGNSEQGSHLPARKLANRSSTRPSGRVRIETQITMVVSLILGRVAPGLRVG